MSTVYVALAVYLTQVQEKSLLPMWLLLQGCQVTALDIDDGSFYESGSLHEWYAAAAKVLDARPPEFIQGDIQRKFAS